MIWIVAGIGILVLSLYTCSSGDHRFRYRMTVEIETPKGLRSGSSIQEVRAGVQNNLGLLPPSRKMETIGEAVAVDLANRQTVFVLIPSAERVEQALDPDWRNDWVESARRIASGETPKKAVDLALDLNRDRTSSGLPTQVGALFVRFRDIQQPATVEELNPADLAASLGAGYSMRRVTIEKVDGPVTSGIERRLPWLPKFYNNSFSGDRYLSFIEQENKGLAAILSSGAFSVGLGLSERAPST